MMFCWSFSTLVCFRVKCGLACFHQTHICFTLCCFVSWLYIPACSCNIKYYFQKWVINNVSKAALSLGFRTFRALSAFFWLVIIVDCIFYLWAEVIDSNDVSQAWENYRTKLWSIEQRNIIESLTENSKFFILLFIRKRDCTYLI